jgi:hypothetical protein
MNAHVSSSDSLPRHPLRCALMADTCPAQNRAPQKKTRARGRHRAGHAAPTTPHAATGPRLVNAMRCDARSTVSASKVQTPSSHAAELEQQRSDSSIRACSPLGAPEVAVLWSSCPAAGAHGLSLAIGAAPPWSALGSPGRWCG